MILRSWHDSLRRLVGLMLKPSAPQHRRPHNVPLLLRTVMVVAGIGLASSAGQATTPVQTPPSSTPSSAAPTSAAPSSTLKPYVPSASSSESSQAKPQAAKPKPSGPKPASATSSVKPTTVATPQPQYSQLLSPTSETPLPLKQPIAPAKGLPQPPVPVAVSRPISAEDIETFTDSAVRTLMARDHVLGVSVAVVQGGTPLLVKGYGYDSLSPARAVNPQTSQFRLGSVTKVFTWIIARQEIEAGRMNLDAPISTYLTPDIFTDDRRFKPITMRALMTHSAGFDDTSLGHLFQLNPNRLDTTDTYFRVHRPRLVREPLVFSSYSNYGAGLAALALVKTSHAKDVPSLMDARIFTPMGMTSTTLREPYSTEVATAYRLPTPMSQQRQQNLSGGFLYNGTDFVRQPFEYTEDLAGALSGSSTANDMSKLMSLMLAGGNYNGVQIYGRSSAEAFARPLQKMPKGFNGWASGLMIRESPTGQTTYGHTGSTLWFSSNMILVPELNIGIFITANTQGGENLTNTYPDLLLAHLSGEEAPAPATPLASQAYAENAPFYRAISREYVSTRRAYGGLEGAVTRLINTIKITVTPDGRLILGTNNGVSTYVPATADGFFRAQNRDDNGPARDLGMLHFLMDTSHKKVIGIETASNLMRYEPIGFIHSPEVLSLLSVGVALSAIMLWLGLIRGYTRQERPSEGQMRATMVSTGISILWVLAILIIHNWKHQIEANPTSLFIEWPNGQVRLASFLALLASIGTVFQLVTLYFIYTEDRRFNDGWAMWQKVAHTLLIVFWLLFSIILLFWGALNPFA